MYKNALYQINQLPPIRTGMIVQASALYGNYVGIIVQGVAGTYSYISLQSGNRILTESNQLSWDTMFNEGTVVAVWNSIVEWIKDGSPLSS